MLWLEVPLVWVHSALVLAAGKGNLVASDGAATTLPAPTE
jgi:hypothetical protein